MPSGEPWSPADLSPGADASRPPTPGRPCAEKADGERFGYVPSLRRRRPRASARLGWPAAFRPRTAGTIDGGVPFPGIGGPLPFRCPFRFLPFDHCVYLGGFFPAGQPWSRWNVIAAARLSQRRMGQDDHPTSGKKPPNH